jgi:hypothetical protein
VFVGELVLIANLNSYTRGVREVVVVVGALGWNLEFGSWKKYSEPFKIIRVGIGVLVQVSNSELSRRSWSLARDTSLEIRSCKGETKYNTT